MCRASAAHVGNGSLPRDCTHSDHRFRFSLALLDRYSAASKTSIPSIVGDKVVIADPDASMQPQDLKRVMKYLEEDVQAETQALDDAIQSVESLTEGIARAEKVCGLSHLHCLRYDDPKAYSSYTNMA